MRLLKRLLTSSSLVLLCVFFLTASVPHVPAGSWQAWNPMGDLRSGATAALLQDGRVLISGGSNSTGAVASGDLFGTNGVFSAAAPMNSPRSGHAATLLKDGRVLVTGGDTGSGITNSAEVYDPDTASWSLLGATMLDARAGHTASLLPDGRVLLAGGHNSGGALSSLEIFDPLNDTFTSAGSLTTPRMNHAAAMLGDGRVLVIGGTADGTNPLATVDIYDPVTGTVAVGPSLSIPRMSATATTTLEGKVAVIGGSNSSQDLASAEIFDPATGQFALSASSLANPRSGQSAFLLPNNNAILIVGGSSGGSDLSSAELYSPRTDSFQTTGAMSVARPGMTGSAVGLDGRFLAAGGTALASTELYGFATVKTDQSDYAPGTIVTITGSGWQPGEIVTLTLVESPLIDTHPAMTAVADGNGNISNNQFSPDVYDINVRFYLTAVGSQSGLQAQNTFTDAVSVGKITSVGAQTPSPVTAGASATYSITVTFNGNGGTCTSTLTASGLPTGASASFSNNPFTSSGANQVSTLTVSTSSSTPPATTTFTITATGSGGCGGSTTTGTTGNAASPALTVVDQLGFGQQPSNTTAGSAISPAVTVRILDNSNNLVTTGAGSTAGVTIAIGTNPGSGTLSGTLTRSAVGGIATLNNLSINKAGIGYTLVASGTNLVSATSNSFNITPGAASSITATAGTPQSAAVNTAFATALQATVTDANANPVSGATVTFTAPATGASGKFASNTNTTTAVTNASGVATASTLTANTTIGSYTVTASTTGVATPANFSLTNTAGAATTLVVSAPASSTVGSTFAVTVTAQDALGNTTTSYTGTVHFTSSDGAAALPADYTFVAGDNGVHSFSNGVTLNTAGSQTVTATDLANGVIAGSATVTVNPKLAFTPNTPFASVAGICSATVTVQTQNGNGSAANQNSARTLNLSSSSANGQFFSDAACLAPNQITSVFIPLNSSSASFFYKDTSIGNPVITVASSGLTSITQTEDITSLRFQPNSFTVQLNQCSAALLVQSINPNPTALTQSTTINLSTSSAGGAFYSNSNCTTPITTTTIAPGIDGGHDTNGFFYKDSSAGSATLTASAGTASGTATAIVVAPPSISKTFGAASIPLNGTTSLSFTITNPAANTVPLTGVAFTDTLPVGLVVNTPNGLSGTCGGGTITAVASSGSVSLSGATLATNASCTFSVNVKGTSTGVKNNTTGAVTSTNGGTGNTASASVTVTARTTSTTISPLTVSTPVGVAATFTITVTDTDSGLASNPVGTVAVTSASSPANTDSVSACTLAQGANPVGTVACQVTATPTTPFAVHTINASFTATDSVHANSSTTTGAALTVFNPDTKAPVVTISFSAPDGQNNWYVHSTVLGTVSADDTTTGNSNVTAITCLDGGSPLTVGSPMGVGTPSASGSLSVAGEGTHNISCTATDSAGNTGAFNGSTTMPVVVKIDAVAPVLTAIRLTAPNGNGWNNTNVSVRFACADSTSGVTSIAATGAATGGSTTSPLDLAVTSEGLNQSVNASCNDAAGNSATPAGVSNINIDKTKPVITGGRTPAANANGWNNTDVMVTFTCAETGAVQSGLDTNTVAAQTLTAEVLNASVTNTGSCVDKAGNAADAAAVSGINIDKTPPNAPTAVRTPPANTNGWNNTDVSVSFTSNGDTGAVQSGIDSCTTSSTLSAETAGTDVSGTCTDTAGNISTVAKVTVKIDKTPPGISGNRTPLPNTNGWNNVDVAVSFTCAESGAVQSGIATSTVAGETVTTEGIGQSVTNHGTCVDVAGNAALSATVNNINIDKTKPTASASRDVSPNAYNWNNTPVTVSFSGNDSLSGIDTCDAPVTISSEGANQSASGTCKDKAGNVSDPASVTGINIDMTKPVMTGSRSPLANSYGWNNTDVTVSFTCADAGSAQSGIATNTAAGATLSGEGAGQSVTNSGSCTDKAGNPADSSTVSAINIDKTNPTITLTITPVSPAATGWYNTSTGQPTVSFTCGDALSGVASCTPLVLVGEGANQTISGTAMDKAGNSASTSITHVNVDVTAPTISLGNPANGGNYLLNQSANASYSCADSGSSGLVTGLAGCGGPVTSGSQFDTASVGSKSFTLNAKDVAGNTASKTSLYGVFYSTGACLGSLGHTILQPINFTGDSVFPKKQGSTVPAKFRVCDANGVSIGTPGVVSDFRVVQVISNTVTTTANELVDSTTPDSAFRWSGDQWIFNISTKNDNAGSTYFFRIFLNDGTNIDFDFGLR